MLDTVLHCWLFFLQCTVWLKVSLSGFFLGNKKTQDQLKHFYIEKNKNEYLKELVKDGISLFNI